MPPRVAPRARDRRRVAIHPACAGWEMRRVSPESSCRVRLVMRAIAVAIAMRGAVGTCLGRIFRQPLPQDGRCGFRIALDLEVQALASRLVVSLLAIDDRSGRGFARNARL